MFTQCPNCEQIQPLTVNQLRETRAICVCQGCQVHFDALERLTDTASDLIVNNGKDLAASSSSTAVAMIDALGLLKPSADVIENSRINTPLEASIIMPWERINPVFTTNWRIGAWLGLLVLLGQVLYFHGNDISQNHLLRRICQPLNCPLPIFQNTAEWRIVRSSLQAQSNQSQLLEIVITNQAKFAQTYPDIILSVQDYAGNAFARRRFLPEDYLLNSNAVLIKPQATVILRLELAPMYEVVAGYTFDLAY